MQRMDIKGQGNEWNEMHDMKDTMDKQTRSETKNKTKSLLISIVSFSHK